MNKINKLFGRALVATAPRSKRARSTFAARLEGGKSSGQWRVVTPEVAAAILASPAGKVAVVRGVAYGVLAQVPPPYAVAGETKWRAETGAADRLWTWDFGAKFMRGVLPQSGRVRDE